MSLRIVTGKPNERIERIRKTINKDYKKLDNLTRKRLLEIRLSDYRLALEDVKEEIKKLEGINFTDDNTIFWGLNSIIFFFQI